MAAPQTSGDPAQDAALFLRTLFAGQPEGTLIGVGHLANKKWRSHFVTTPESALPYLVGSVDGFVRVTPMTSRPKTGRGGDELSAALMGVMFDIDVNGAPDGKGGVVANAAPDMDAAMELAHAVLEPTLLVDSGYGRHPYVLFDTPWILSTEEDRAEAGELLAGWHARMHDAARDMGIRKLDSVGQLSRPMRVPGTMNGKGERPAPVALLDDGGPRYAIGDVRQHVKRAVPREKSAPLPDQDVTALLERHEDLAKLVKRKGRAPGAGSGSEWDFAIGCQATKHELSDAEIGALIRHSRAIHNDAKGEREDYVERTVAAVRARIGYPTHDPEAILPQLDKLTEIGPQLGRRIVSILQSGDPDDGPITLQLDDDSELFSKKFSDLTIPARLSSMLATQLGVVTKFDALQANKVAALCRRYLGRHNADSRDRILRGVVVDMLARVEDAPFIFTDQEQRWKMWLRVYEHEVSKDAAPEVFARQIIVPRDTATEDRFVLASWAQTYLRLRGMQNPTELVHLLKHIGWRSRGKTGRIKATDPNGTGERGMAFYIVPGGWEKPEWGSEA